MRPLLLAAVISIASVGCIHDSTAEGPVGTAVARITQVPPLVGCVAITVVGSRTVTNTFDVTPGQPATLTMRKLPVGSDSFTSTAYDAACNAIAGAQPSWSTTAPFVAPVNQGAVTSLVLTLEPTGGAVIGINFDTDGGGCVAGDGGTCVGSDGGLGDGGPTDGGVFDLSPTDGGPGPDLASAPPDLTSLPDLTLPPG